MLIPWKIPWKIQIFGDFLGIFLIFHADSTLKPVELAWRCHWGPSHHRALRQCSGQSPRCAVGNFWTVGPEGPGHLKSMKIQLVFQHANGLTTFMGKSEPETSPIFPWSWDFPVIGPWKTNQVNMAMETGPYGYESKPWLTLTLSCGWWLLIPPVMWKIHR